MRLSGGLLSTTRQCEGFTRLSLICAALVAAGMTRILCQGAPARARATPWVRSLVCGHAARSASRVLMRLGDQPGGGPGPFPGAIRAVVAQGRGMSNHEDPT